MSGGWGWLNPVNDAEAVGGALVDAGTFVVNGVEYAGQTLVHIGGQAVQLTESMVRGALGAVSDAISEVTNLLDLLGDSTTVRQAGQTLVAMADQIRQGGDQVDSVWQAMQSGSFWKGPAADAFTQQTYAEAVHLYTAANALGDAGHALLDYAAAMDDARSKLEAAKNSLGGLNPVDVIEAPFKIPGILNDAHNAADALKASGRSVGERIYNAAESAPDVGDLHAHSESFLQHIENAFSNNWKNFASDPFGYINGFETSVAQGFFDGAKGFAVGIWNLGKASFETQWGTLLGIKSWQEDGEKTFESMANGLWHLSTPYWIYRFATDPNGAAEQGITMLNGFIHWDQIEAGHANTVVGHLEGEIGFQALAFVATDGIATALSGGADAADVAGGLAEVGDGASGLVDGSATATDGAGAVAHALPESAGATTDLSFLNQGYNIDGIRTAMGSSYDGDYAAAQAFQHAHPELANVPTEQLAAVRGYTDFHVYGPANAALRSGDAAAIQQYQDFITAADRGLEHLPAYDGTVYRGTTLTPDQAARYVPGETVTEPAFTSTAANASSQFAGNTEFVITSTDGRVIGDLSHFTNEREVLFRPGSEFEVLSVQSDVATHKLIIQMAQVG